MIGKVIKMRKMGCNKGRSKKMMRGRTIIHLLIVDHYISPLGLVLHIIGRAHLEAW